jgi:hypothetical protein
VIYPHFRRRDSVNDGVPAHSYDGVDLIPRPGRRVTVKILLSPQTRALLQRRHRLVVDVLVKLPVGSGVSIWRFAVPLVLA